MAILALLGLAEGCAATPRPVAVRAAQTPPAVRHVTTAMHHTVTRAAAKVCLPEKPVLDDAKRDELFRQFQQEEAKRAGQ